jgi:hypothetical protein
MKKHVITAVAVLGLGAVTIAVAQPGNKTSTAQSTRTIPPPDQACEGVDTDRDRLHARVAKLRAEVELLQIEHDATKALLSDRLKAVVVANAETIGEIDELRIVTYYMRMGAEKVGKAAEFDKAVHEDRATIDQAITKAREIPTELDRKKQEFLRLSTALNQKKIELVELETKLDGTM